MTLGILVPEFPSQTHIFFWREIATMRELGVPVALLSTRRPSATACRHEFAAAARDETRYVFPPRWGRAIGVLATRPVRLVRGLRYVLGLREAPLRQRLRYLGLLPCAADLLDHSAKHGIRHIHAHSCADAAHLVALCRILGGPTYSLTLHGDLPIYGTDHASKMERASAITCAGAHLRAQIVEHAGVPADRVLPTVMGLDTRRFSDGGPRAQRARALHLVTTARLDACKGHRFALAAIKTVTDLGYDIRYTLIGEGEERGALEAEVAHLGLADRVELLGTRGEADVLDLLKRADAFALPSVGRGEAAPVSLMEAMACGLPVISSIIGATPDMVTDGVEGFLVAQADVPALATAIRRLADDPALRRRMGLAARRRAAESFDVRDTTSRVLAFLEQRTSLQLRPS